MPYTSPMRAAAQPKQNPWARVVLTVALFVSLLLAVCAILYYTNHLPFWRRRLPQQAATGSSLTKGETPSTEPSSVQSGSQTKTDTSTTSNQTPTNTSGQSTSPPITGSLAAPWGTFANVYSAKTTDQMQSTCNTTPGATCQIIFTNGNAIKTLDPETADAGGAVYWGWTPASIGLTPGTWHITAKAVLSSQTKTTSNDPLTLEIH